MAPSIARSIGHRNGQSSIRNRIDEEETNAPPPKRKVRFAIVPLLLVAIGGGVFWYQQSQQSVSTDDAFVDGHVIQVCPKIAAQVAALHFEDNYFVHKGDLLLELDPRDFEIKVSSANASLSAAKSRLAQTQAQMKVWDANLGETKADLASCQAMASNAMVDLRRNQQLIKKHVIDQRELDQSSTQSATSQGNLEAARRKMESAQAQITLCVASCQTAKAELLQAEAQLSDAQLQLSYTRIYASEEGRITKKGVEPGDYVQPGQTLFLLVPSEVWVTANFKETQLHRIQVGQPVTIRVDANKNRLFHGHVESFQFGTCSRFTLLPTENATGNYVKVVQRVPVKIVFDEPGQDLTYLCPGESVEPVVDVNSRSETKAAHPLPRAVLGGGNELSF